MISKIKSVFDSGSTSSQTGNTESTEDGENNGQQEIETEEPFGIRMDSEVLGTGFSRKELKNQIQERSMDLASLKAEIRGSWKKYQRSLEATREKTGIDELKAKTDAKEWKQQALDYEQLYKILWKEYSALKNALRKDEITKIMDGDTYGVSLSDMNIGAVEEVTEDHISNIMEREEKVDIFNDSVASIEDQDVEIDFSDVEKDISELEMQDMDVDIFVEEDAPEIEAETGEDWS